MLLDEQDRRLIDGWQRDLPIVSAPFAAVGATLGLPESDVLARLATSSPIPVKHAPPSTISTPIASQLPCTCTPKYGMWATPSKMDTSISTNIIRVSMMASMKWAFCIGVARNRLSSFRTRRSTM